MPFAIHSTGAATALTSGASRASDGPGDFELPYLGQKRTFRGYSARGVGLSSRPEEIFDDGTIAPTAVLGSLPFAEEIVVPATREMHKRYGQYIYGKYGFVDAFNPSFDYDVALKRGRRVRGVGWVATDYLGIDQGAIISMIENHRSELHVVGDEAQPLPAPRTHARRFRRRLARPTARRIRNQPPALILPPALSASCGTRAGPPTRACRRSSCARR